MIWERCKRDEPATGLGRSLFTPLPRHASVLESPRRNREATSSPTRMPTSSDPAEGSFLPRESDPTGFMAGVEEVRRGGASNVGQWRGGLKGGGSRGGSGARWQRGRWRDALV